MIPVVNQDIQGHSHGMTEDEKKVMAHLVAFWNEFLKLPGANGTDIIGNVHAIQGVMAIRVAKRVNPEVWG